MIAIDRIVFIPRPYGEDLNINIRNQRAAATAHLSVEKVEQVWQRDHFNYVGRHGFNGKPEKYAGVLMHLRDHHEIWRPMLDLRIPNPEAIRFSEGRHTFAALRDMGAVTVEFAVPDCYRDILLARYG